jgi:hypothetical protein
MIRAKFIVSGVRATTVYRNATGNEAGRSVPAKRFELSTVPGGPDAPENDQLFGDATPTGGIDITIAEDAGDQLLERLGQAVYVDFSPAD